MKTLDKKHKLEYQDVFLYSTITSKIINSTFKAEISSPFLFKDGNRLDLILTNDSVVGIGQRNFQRERLFNNRGYLLLSSGNGHKNKIIGSWNKKKEVFTLYATERLEPEEIKVLNIIKTHLTNNNITVIIDIEEKNRYRCEIRLRKGDKIQQHSNLVGEHFRNNNDEDEEEEDY